MKSFSCVISTIVVLSALSCVGCQSEHSLAHDRATGPTGKRDTIRAHELTATAIKLMEANPEEARRLLEAALRADLYHGPAHNNLGVLHLMNDELYEAAHQFEWARKLMPGHPDPRMNLALTLERAGRHEEAITTYRAALEVYRGHIPTLQALTRLQVRTRLVDSDTLDMLELIALGGEDEVWRRWARNAHIRLSDHGPE